MPDDTPGDPEVEGSDPGLALEVRGISRAFHGVQAVEDATLEVPPGECHGLVGENGAGKSTLIKVIGGSLAPDRGTVTICGTPTTGSIPRAQAAGLAVLHQEITLIPQLDAAENIGLGHAVPTRAGLAVDWPEVRAHAQRAVDRLGLQIPLDVAVGRLSPAMQTMVAIARAVAFEARVLILDEPTASLTDQETVKLFDVVRRLREQGVAIVYVSHRLEEIFELCDRVTVMRDGRVVATDAAEALDVDRLIRAMVGRSPERMFPESQRQPGETLLSAHGLTGERVEGLDLTVRRGEVVGIAGLGGSGRSELLRLLAGAQRPRDGQLRRAGREVSFRSPRAALKEGVALVPEERRSQALVLTRSVAHNLLLSDLSRLGGWGGLVSKRREAERARGIASDLQIKVAATRQNVQELSGGNQQKVVLGRVLSREPEVLLLDEPTRGIDVGTKVEIYRLIRELADAGRGVVVVSSELPELLGLVDRVVVLHEGRVTAQMDADGADPEVVLSACYGRTR